MISLISGKYDGFSKGGETVIEFQNVTKTYRVMKRQAGFGSAVKALFSREHETIQALCDVSFTVGDGEIVGYIGPNGAGKSTTVKIMCGILTPTSGELTVNGLVLFCCGILVSALMVVLPVWMFSRGLRRYESGNG